MLFIRSKGNHSERVDRLLACASHTAAITMSRMGAMPSLPTIGEVQDLLRERGYQGFDPAELDSLN